MPMTHCLPTSSPPRATYLVHVGLHIFNHFFLQIRVAFRHGSFTLAASLSLFVEELRLARALYPKNWIFLVRGKKRGEKSADSLHARGSFDDACKRHGAAHAADKIHTRERKKDGRRGEREEGSKIGKKGKTTHLRICALYTWPEDRRGNGGLFSEKKKKSENLTGAGAQEEERM